MTNFAVWLNKKKLVILNNSISSLLHKSVNQSLKYSHIPLSDKYTESIAI